MPDEGSLPEIPKFSYEKKLKDIPVHREERAERKTWTEYQLEFKVKDFPDGQNEYARAFYFVQKSAGHRAPCLVLLPPTSGPIYLIRLYAKAFADKGYTVMAFHRRESFPHPNRPVDANVNLFRQAVIDVRRGLDYFETREDADATRIGVLGISLGGIIAALATESDRRIKAAAMVVSAAHLADILDTSGYTRVRRLRAVIMKQHNVRRDELKAYCEPILAPVDPATYADRIDPARLMMINGRSDNIIKLSVVNRSWETYGRPARYLTIGGHYPMIAAASFSVAKAHEHFMKVMALEEDEDGKVRAVGK